MVQVSLLFLCAFRLCLGAYHFLASSETPFSLQSVVLGALSELENQPKVRITEVKTLESLHFSPQDELFDYSYSPIIAAFLRDTGLPLVPMWQEVHHGDAFTQALAKYLQMLNFTEVRVISDADMWNLRTSQSLRTHFPLTFDPADYTVSQNLSLSAALQFVGEVLKPSGATLFVLLTAPSTAETLLSAFQAKKLNKAGYAFVLSDQARYLSSANYSAAGNTRTASCSERGKLLGTVSGTAVLANCYTSIQQSRSLSSVCKHAEWYT